MLNTLQPPQTEENLPKEDTRLSVLFPIIATILAGTFVWITFIFSRQEQRYSLPPDSITKLNPQILKPITPEELANEVAYYETSEINQVSPELIAEKNNPNRKIISPKSSEDAEKIKAIVEQSGGTIIDTNQSNLVIEYPQSNEQNLETQLAENNVDASVEVDVPTFVLAESDVWNLAKIEAPKAWEITQGESTRIGIIDTGIDYTHPELISRYVGGYDSVDEDLDPRDVHGHGTHVAGIVASSLNNSGTAGVAPGANLYAYKAISDSGVGYVSDMIESIDRAMNDGVQVINLSIGTDQSVIALENKVKEAANRGITIVAAAGNTNGGAVMYPAAYDAVLSVTATDENDQLASFSSLGGDIAAPGVNILSTLPGGRYGTMSGTSMAAPHVAATAALLIAKGETNPKQLLLATTYDLGTVGPDGIYGYGRLQTGESVAPASPSPTPQEPSPTPPEPSPTPTTQPDIEQTPIATDSSEATSSAKNPLPKIDQATNSAQIRRRSLFSPTSPTPKPTPPSSSQIIEEKIPENSRAVRTIYRVIEEIFKNQTNRNGFGSSRFLPSTSTKTSPTPIPSVSPSPSVLPTNSPDSSESPMVTSEPAASPETNVENSDNEIDTNREAESEKSTTNRGARPGRVRGATSSSLTKEMVVALIELLNIVL